MSSYKEALGQNAVLRRIKGLKNINFKSRPAKYSTSPEAYSRKDQKTDGLFVEDFRDNIIPGAVTHLAPFWNDLKDTFWSEDITILHRIINEGNIKIRYPDDHPFKAGQVIKAEEVDPNNFWDPFFQSNELKSKRMTGGKYNFDLQKDPIDAILYYVYKNDPRVLVRDGSEISKYVVGSAEYELIIPTFEKNESKNNLRTEIDALTLLGKLSFEKQKTIGFIMKVRVNDRKNPDPDTLYLELGRIAKSNKKISTLGVSEQERFTYLCKLSNEDLMLISDITKALDYRLITHNRNEFLFNNEVLKNVISHNDLERYFKDPEHIEQYKDLIYLINEKEKVLV